MTTSNKNLGNYANDPQKASEAGKKAVKRRMATFPMIGKRSSGLDVKAINTATVAAASRK